MTSTLLYRRRGTVLLYLIGGLLLCTLAILAFGSIAIVDSASMSLDALSQSLFSPLAQVVALLVWGTLALLLGLIYARAFLGSTSLLEVFLVGALLSSAAFPLLYVAFTGLFTLLDRTDLTPQIVLGTTTDIYALPALFFMLLLGLLLLIAREVMRAATKPL